MARFDPTTLDSTIEDSLLTTQKKALLRKSYQVVQGLALASRTATTSTAIIANPGYKGVMVLLNVTAVTGAAGVKLRILSGCDAPNTIHLDAASRTTVGYSNVAVYPGGSSSAVLVCQPSVLGNSVQIQVNHDNADPITYEVRYHFIE